MERRKSLLLMVGRRSAARQGKYLGMKFTLFLVNEILQLGTNLREDLSSWDAKGEVKLMFINQLNNSFLLFFCPLYDDGDGILPPTSPGLVRRCWCRPRHSCSRCSPPATALQGLRKSDTHGEGPVCRIHDIHQLCHLSVRGRRGIDAQMESMDLEREKGITIQSAATCCTLNGYQITRDCCKTYQKNTSQSKMTYETKREAFIIQCGNY